MLHNSVNVMMKKPDEGRDRLPVFHSTARWTGGQALAHGAAAHALDITGERLSAGEARICPRVFDAGHILGSVGTSFAAHGRKIFYTGRRANSTTRRSCKARVFPRRNWIVLINRNHARRPAHSEGLRVPGRNCDLRPRSRPLSIAAPAADPAFRPRQDAGNPRDVLRVSPPGLARPGADLHRRPRTKLAEIYDRLARHTPRQNPHLQILDAVAPFTMACRTAEATPLKGGRLYAIPAA